MKLLLCVIAGLATMTFAGCNHGSTTTASSTSAGSTKVHRLTVTSPGDLTVDADKTAEVTITITRDQVKGPVDIEFRDLPPTVTVMTKEMTIPADKSSLTVTLKAGATAKAMEKHKALVVAKAKEVKDLPEAIVEFSLNVKPKQ